MRPNVPLPEEKESEIKDTVLLLQMQDEKPESLEMKLAVDLKLSKVSNDIRSEAEGRRQNVVANQDDGTDQATSQTTAPIQRMGIMEARTAFDSNTSEERTKYGDLFADWLKVHSDKAGELLPPKGDKEGLRDLLDQWEVNPRRQELVEQAAQRFAESDRQNWVGRASKWEVFQLLTAGVQEQAGDAEKLGKLLDNFRSVGATHFQYTMQRLSSDNFLRSGGEGDCNTLTHSFRDICEKWLRIPCEMKSSKDVGFPGRFFTPEHKTVDGKTGNVQGKYWAFENHFWVRCGGKDYDVLFGESGTVNTASWLPLKSTTDKGVEIFGDEPTQFKVMATEHDEVQRRYILVD